jgi:peroxiredoxin
MRLTLGTHAPEFTLPDPHGQTYSLADFATADALVVAFICNHCPYVKHLAGALADLAREMQKRNVAFVGINSNDFEKYPDDSPAKMIDEARLRGYTFPYLVDATQEVAHAYHAACTPDFFVFDRSHKLAYCGQFDDSRPNNGLPVTGTDLRQAIEAVVAGRTAPSPQRPSIGCNIKWKPGNAPDYFG